tara:strand:+ start:12772 stop:13263 length:492 start_codon:yes stop_codon:yes gene_type:complete
MQRSLADISRDLLIAKTEYEIFKEEDLQKRIDELRDEQAKKEDGIYFFYQDFDKEIEIFDHQIKKAQRYVKFLKNEQERIKGYVVSQFQLTNKLPKHSALNPLKVRESQGAVDIIDESKIPEQYWVEVITKKLDKKRILKELKSGNEITGVRLIKKDFVTGLK